MIVSISRITINPGRIGKYEYSVVVVVGLAAANSIDMVGDSFIEFVNSTLSIDPVVKVNKAKSTGHASVRTNSNLGTNHITIWLENIKQISVACFAEEVVTRTT